MAGGKPVSWDEALKPLADRLGSLARGGQGSKEGLWRALFADADRALYHAKEHGRDRYVLASSMAAPVPGHATAMLEPVADSVA